MDIYDNEIEIIKRFHDVQSSEVFLLPEDSDECEQIFLAVHQEDQWSRWKDTSGKADPPPDFYSDELGLMMDVMRVDDHSRIGKNGKSIVNPTLQRETEVTRELKEKGIFEPFPNAKPILIVDTGLSTDEDHNYAFYRDNFVRTVEAHKKKIPQYQKNHPGYKTIFFVFDEASPYFEAKEKPVSRRVGDITQGQPHLWFWDRAFIRTIEGSQIDYLIWYTPYKHFSLSDSTGKHLELPKVTVMKVKGSIIDTKEFSADRMMSAEL